MEIHVKEEPIDNKTCCCEWKIYIHPTTVGAYILESAVHNMQKHMAISGKALCADKIGVLLCNLHLLTKTPKRLSKRTNAPSHMEFFDTTSVRGISGAIEAATTLLPTLPLADTILRVLGRFSSVDDCAVAPKGTRAAIQDISKTLAQIHK